MAQPPQFAGSPPPQQPPFAQPMPQFGQQPLLAQPYQQQPLFVQQLPPQFVPPQPPAAAPKPGFVDGLALFGRFCSELQAAVVVVLCIVLIVAIMRVPRPAPGAAAPLGLGSLAARSPRQLVAERAHDLVGGLLTLAALCLGNAWLAGKYRAWAAINGGAFAISALLGVAAVAASAPPPPGGEESLAAWAEQASLAREASAKARAAAAAASAPASPSPGL